MAVTTSPYNHTLKLFLNQEVDVDALKVMLLDGTAAFDATHTSVNQVSNTGAYEVDGNGWDTGGEALASEAVTVVSTSGAMLDAADLEVTATGGAIGPADAALILDATNATPLFFIDFGESKTADEGTPFKVTFNANGLARVTWTA